MAQDKQAGKPAVQIEVRTPAKEAEYERVLVTWVSTELKPKIGTIIVNPPQQPLQVKEKQACRENMQT